MLVLTRRTNETIEFPSINATVELLQVKGNVARIGIRAPRDVPVLRGELMEKSPTGPDAVKIIPSASPRSVPSPALAGSTSAGPTLASPAKDVLSHSVRNLLNITTVGLSLLSRQVQTGMMEEAEATIKMVLENVEKMKQKAETRHEEARRSLRSALLVEDDDNERQLLAGYLRTSGFTVDTASDGMEAIEFLNSHDRPDVVLMDMRMPRCDGGEAVRVIRQNPQHQGLKIFAVSGADASEMKLNGDIDRWFQKPLDPAALVQELSLELSSTPP